MSKQERTIGCNVLITPEAPYIKPGTNAFDTSCAHYRKADELRAKIVRHIDDPGVIDLQYVTESTCSHCGDDWTEDGPVNGCCDADEAERDALEAKMSLETLEAYAREASEYAEQAEAEADRRRTLLTKVKAARQVGAMHVAAFGADAHD